MKCKSYSILRNPQNNEYTKLIECGGIYCRRFLLVILSTMPLDQGAEDVLEKLNPWLLDRKETNRWPGTILYDGYTASVFTFTLNDCTKKILIESSSSLYSWRQPFLPEDLCFLREDGREWLVTIAHENEAYLALEPEEKEYIQYAIPALLLRED